MSENMITLSESALAKIVADAASAAVAAALGQQAVTPSVDPAPEQAQAPKTERKGRPINRTNRERLVKAMTKDGWEGHEHMSTRDLIELLGDDVPKGFYVPTGTVKAQIEAWKAAQEA